MSNRIEDKNGWVQESAYLHIYSLKILVVFLQIPNKIRVPCPWDKSKTGETESRPVSLQVMSMSTWEHASTRLQIGALLCQQKLHDKTHQSATGTTCWLERYHLCTGDQVLIGSAGTKPWEGPHSQEPSDKVSKENRILYAKSRDRVVVKLWTTDRQVTGSNPALGMAFHYM